MPKLREILTSEEHNKVGKLRLAMLNAESIKESNYYKSEIEKIFAEAKDRYFASIKEQPSCEKKSPQKIKVVTKYLRLKQVLQ